MSELKTMLMNLKVATAPSAIDFGEDGEFLEKYKNLLPRLLLGLFKVGVVNPNGLPHRTPLGCALCERSVDDDGMWIKGRAYWGREPKRLRAHKPVPMCVDCHLECGAAIGPDAALYVIDERGHSLWIAGQHRFTPAQLDGGKAI